MSTIVLWRGTERGMLSPATSSSALHRRCITGTDFVMRSDGLQDDFDEVLR